MPNHHEILQYLTALPWVIFLAVAGGFVSFIRRLNNQPKPENLAIVFVKLIGELCISGFAGVITYLICQEWGVSASMTAVLVGISGHLGGNAIDLISNIVQKFFQSK